LEKYQEGTRNCDREKVLYMKRELLCQGLGRVVSKRPDIIKKGRKDVVGQVGEKKKIMKSGQLLERTEGNSRKWGKQQRAAKNAYNDPEPAKKRANRDLSYLALVGDRDKKGGGGVRTKGSR